MNLAAIPALASDDTFHVVVETPRGSSLKLKYDPTWQAIAVSRPLLLGLVYPFDWGFIPSTRMEDGDPLDAMLVWDVSSYPGVVVECRALGVLQVEQNRSSHDQTQRIRNDRIVSVPIESRREQDFRTVTDLSERVRKEFEQFAVAVTALEGKDAEVVGWGDAQTALRLIRTCAISA